MIADQDRSGWIGASDVEYVIGNWKTKTWEKWWLQKLGINQSHFDNKYTMAGTNWEHRILESLGLPNLTLDAQYRNEELRLRVNLDGNTDINLECKTYKHDPCKRWAVPKKYIHQCQIQMYVSPFKTTNLIAYGLVAEDYDNYLRAIDPARRSVHPIAYDPSWVETVYLPKHRILLDCLKRGAFPTL